MAKGDVSLSEVSRQLAMSRTTLRRRMLILGIVPQRIGQTKILSAEQFAAIVADDDIQRAPNRSQADKRGQSKIGQT